jgi:predicted RNA binding protein with dsRBD fold (UPF0201 family)
MRKRFKHVVKFCVEADLNPVTIIVRMSKAEILRFIDKLLPDEVEEK